MRPTDNPALLNAHINSFAIRSFRDVGDNDYIVARLAHRARMTPQFLWAGLQAIEKYLKCVLVINRIRADRVHKLQKLLDAFEASKPFSMSLSAPTLSLIEHLDVYGPHRYLEIGTYARREELLDLDRAVWEVRRYARPMAVKVGPLPAERVLSMELQKNLSFDDTPAKFQIGGGRLEAIIRNKDHPARSALLWRNAFYGSMQRKVVRVDTNMSFENAPLQLYPELVDHVREYVHIPPYLAEAYRQKANKKAHAKAS